MKKRLFSLMMALAMATAIIMPQGIEAKAEAAEISYTSPEYQELLNRVKQIVNSAPATAHEKVKYFHDVICQSTEYSMDYNYHIAEPYGVLVEGKAKCVGYADTLEMLCNMAGIKCFTVRGTINAGKTGHRWNIVQLEDGQWYEVDCTFDDTHDNSKIVYDWFLITTEQMNKDHARGPQLLGMDGKEVQIPIATGTQFAYISIKVGDIIENNDIQFVVNNNGTVTINEVAPHTKVLTIPDTIIYKGVEFAVTDIDLKDSGRTGALRSITIGRNVTSIQENAFNGCSHLKKVTIRSEKLKKIGKNSFKDTSKKITVRTPKNCLKKYKKMLQKKSSISKKAKYKKM